MRLSERFANNFGMLDHLILEYTFIPQTKGDRVKRMTIHLYCSNLFLPKTNATNRWTSSK